MKISIRMKYRFQYLDAEEVGVIQAYILIQVESGRDVKVFTMIKKLPYIKKANFTSCIYDGILVELSTVEELDEFVFKRMRNILGMKETVTEILSTINT